MDNRRNFLKKLSLGGLYFTLDANIYSLFSVNTYVSKRPEPKNRKFTSSAIEKTIQKVKKAIHDDELAWMFENCFPNTLDTTVHYYEKNDKPYTYVITGDIDAMWLRDSSAQVWPYLQFAKEDKKLNKMLQGVINKQIECVLIDPYANAFYNNPEQKSKWQEDLTEMKPGVHERKWEIDSLCYILRLSHGYWKATHDITVFDEQWKNAAFLIIKTFREQQRLENKGTYKFQRNYKVPSDTQFGDGYGNPTKKIGLIHSMFRPSDDATFYPFLISSNMFAVVALKQLSEIFDKVYNDQNSAKMCNDFAEEIDMLIKKYAVLNHPYAGEIYPLEIDGFGNALFMDDANVPNLLSIPYIGYTDTNDKIYINTRKFSLSEYNPWYHQGKFANGIGGPHIGENKIWPLGLIMQALTSIDDEEILYCLKTLKNTHANTGFIHESFDVNNPNDFSRSWFAWANTLFGELILNLYLNKRYLLEQL